MKNKLENIILKIKQQKALKQQQKWNKQMVIDAKQLLQNDEIVVNFFTPNFELEERHLKDHNFYLGFHNLIWDALEPHQKLALLMKLDQKLVAEKNDLYTPKSSGNFIIGTFDDSYFAKSENGVNNYYIGLEMLSEENVDSYTMLYMLFALQMQAKAYEQLEQKTENNKVLKDLIFNIKHPIKRTPAYDKFVMQELMTQKEEKEACEFMCQPIEQYAKLNTQKVENIAASINHFGVGVKDEAYELLLEDRAYFDQKEAELIEKTYGKNITPKQVYKNAINEESLEA